MRYFHDIGILFFYALLSAFVIGVDDSFILAFLSAVILVCSCFFLKSARARFCACLLYVALAFLIPTFFVFYPAVFYVLASGHHYIPALASALLALCCPLKAQAHSPALLLAGIFGFLLAFVLQKDTEQYERLDRDFRRTRDAGQERNLLLKETNKTLLEKQDYEIYAATLRERNRIAREIHDNVGHVLSRSILMVGAIKVVNQSDSLSPLICSLEESLNSAMDSIRSSVHDLHDEAVDLDVAIHSLTDSFTFCPVDLRYDMSPEVPRNVKYCMISITKEALANVIRHSNATQLKVILREHPVLYQLCIEDNGTDIPPPADTSGIGLSNMRERVRALDGTMQISTERGFRLFITIPKPTTQKEAAGRPHVL